MFMTWGLRMRERASLLGGKSKDFGKISTMQIAEVIPNQLARNCRLLNKRELQQRSRHELLRGYPAANIW